MYDRFAEGKELTLQSGEAKWNARPVRVQKANGEAGLGMQEREREYGGDNGRRKKRRERGNGEMSEGQTRSL